MTTLQTTVKTIDTWIKRQFNRLLERRWLDLGLRAKMGAMVTIGMLGLMTIFGVLAVSSARQATQQALKARLLLTQMSAETLDAMLLHIMDDMELYAQLFLPTNFTGDLSEQEIRMRQISVFDLPIYYLDSTRKLINHSGSIPPPISWNEVPAIQLAFEGQTSNVSAWSQYQPGTMIIATPIIDSTGVIQGVLATLVDLSNPHIFPVETNFETESSQLIDLVDQEGHIVFSNQEGRVLKNLTEDLILTQLFSKRLGGVETCLGCPGAKPAELNDEVVAFAPLSSVPFGVVIRQPAEQVFYSVRRLVVWHTLLGLISMVGALGLVWATTNGVIDPLKTLNDAAQRIAGGDLETPIDPLSESWPSNRHRRDEIGALGKSFNTMRLRLKDSIHEVQALNRNLDIRVQERTAQAIVSQKEAQAARDDLQAIIDSLSDEMIVIDVDDRHILQVNQACKEKNRDLGDITGRKCYELFQNNQPCGAPNFACPLKEVVRSGVPVRVTHSRLKAGNNKPVYLDVIASPLINERGRITRIVELIRDVSEERHLSDSLVRRNQQLAILNAVASTVSKSLDIREILDLALREVVSRTGVDVGAIFLVEDVLGQLNLAAHFGLSEESAYLVSQFGMLDGSCGGVVDHGQLVVVPDISSYAGQRAQTLQIEKLATLVHIPLISKDRTLGSMCVGTRTKNDFGETEQKMLLAIGRQIAVAVESARLYAELQQKEQVARELFRKAISAQEDERKRIARELHDDTSQALTALMFAAEEGLEINDLAEIKTSLRRMHSLTRQTLDGVHKLLYDLRPSMLDHLGLIPAIRWFAKSRLESQGVRVSFKENVHSCRLIPEVEIALFRVVQEAITNITRHAGARNVKISCDLTSEQIQIVISDDGIGFNPTQVILSPETGHGLGLLGMGERLELVGGEFEIDSIPGQGTQINIHMPLSGNGRKEQLV